MPDSPLTLVLGGARSGKSVYAENLFADCDRMIYVATAELFDEEMRARADLHRQRRGSRWQTVETALDLTDTLDAYPGEPMLVDCLTVWLGNLMHAERNLDTESAALVECVAGAPGPIVLVASEVGLGIIPDNAMARRFRDAAGQLNQQIAGVATRVVMVTAGLPLILK